VLLGSFWPLRNLGWFFCESSYFQGHDRGLFDKISGCFRLTHPGRLSQNAIEKLTVLCPFWTFWLSIAASCLPGPVRVKGTFFVQQLMSRSLSGIQIQVLFTGLAANTVRWCKPWLKSYSTHVIGVWARTLDSSKHLARVATNTAALVQDTQWALPCNSRLIALFPASPYS
jgi:hypothetical protein